MFPYRIDDFIPPLGDWKIRRVLDRTRIPFAMAAAPFLFAGFVVHRFRIWDGRTR